MWTSESDHDIAGPTTFTIDLDHSRQALLDHVDLLRDVIAQSSSGLTRRALTSAPLQKMREIAAARPPGTSGK